jgi:hypothetical protein
MASHLTAGNRGVSLRRPAQSAKLSVALLGEAAKELERSHRWQMGTAEAAATETCGDSS